MTARERAEQVVPSLCPGHLQNRLRQKIRAAILEAVAEEREECAKIAAGLIGPNIYLGGYSMQDVRRLYGDAIAAAIRDRTSCKETPTPR